MIHPSRVVVIKSPKIKYNLVISQIVICAISWEMYFFPIRHGIFDRDDSRDRKHAYVLHTRFFLLEFGNSYLHN
jgi:hypothetical protein